MKTTALLTLITALLLPVCYAGADDFAPQDIDSQTLPEAAPMPPAPLGWSTALEPEKGRSGYLHPFVAVTGRYTDNLYKSAKDRENEFTTIITPGLWLVVPPSRQPLLRVNTTIAMPGGLEIARFRTGTTRRYQGFALYRAEIEMNARFPGEDRVNQRGEGFFQYQAPGGLSLELYDMYEEEQDPAFNGKELRNRLDRYKANLFHTLVAVPLFARINIRADYGNYRLNFDAPRNAFRQRDDNLLAARIACGILARSELFLLYEHLDIDYDRELLPDSTEDHGYAGIEWAATARSRGRVMLGYGQKKFRDDAIDDRRDLIGEVRLDHRFTPKSSVYLQVTRKANEPDSPSQGGTLAHRAELGYRQKLTPRLGVAVDVYYLAEDYRDITVIGEQAGVREDSDYSAGVAFGYAPRPWLNMELGYRYLQRDSNFAVVRFRDNTTYLRLSATL